MTEAVAVQGPIQGTFSAQHLCIRRQEFFKAASLHRKGYVLTNLLIALILLKYLYLEIFMKSHTDTFQRRMDQVGYFLFCFETTYLEICAHLQHNK